MTAKVLVTGGAGYIGSHACKALAKSGFTPVTFDNLSFGHRRAVRWGPLVEGDLADESLIRRTIRAHRIEAVLHFAAFAYVGESMSEPGRYFQNNISNSISLLNAAQQENVPHVVFSSSCATYGLPHTATIDETHPQQPINPYGETKLAIERTLHWYGCAHNMRYVALRYFNAAGADADGEIGESHDPETHLIPLIIDAAMGRGPAVSIFGTNYPTADGTAIRDYVHVADLARAHVDALRYLRRGGTSAWANLGTGRGHSVREVISMVEAVSGRTVPVIETTRRAGDPPSLVAASGRARELFGWTPQCSDLRTIVSTAWEWRVRQNASQLAAVSAA